MVRTRDLDALHDSRLPNGGYNGSWRGVFRKGYRAAFRGLPASSLPGFYVPAYADVWRAGWERGSFDRERERISIDGGQEPLWGLNGRELFYRTATGEVMAAAVEIGADFVVREVTAAFPPNGRRYIPGGGVRYDISPVDGRFLLLVGQVGGSNSLIVELNWTQELLERVPVN